MTSPARVAAAHVIATRAGHQIVSDGLAVGLNWIELVMALETTIAAVIATSAVMAGHHAPQRLATELLDGLTERAHVRVTTLLAGPPPGEHHAPPATPPGRPAA